MEHCQWEDCRECSAVRLRSHVLGFVAAFGVMVLWCAVALDVLLS